MDTSYTLLMIVRLGSIPGDGFTGSMIGEESLAEYIGAWDREID